MRITRIVGHKVLFTKVSYDKLFATKEYIYQKLFESLPHQEKPYQVINIPNLTWLTHARIRNKATTKPTYSTIYHYQSIPFRLAIFTASIILPTCNFSRIFCRCLLTV